MRVDQPSQPGYRPQDTGDAAVPTVWDAGIVRVTCQANAIFVGDWHDALEEIRDALPDRLRRQRPGLGERSSHLRVCEAPRAVTRPTAPLRWRGSQYTKDVEVVFDGGDARVGAVPDDLASSIDLVLAFRLACGHDGFPHRRVDGVRRHERELHHVERDAVHGAALLESRQAFDAPRAGGVFIIRITADVFDAMTLEEHQRPVVGRRALATEDHPRTGGLRRRGRGTNRESGGDRQRTGKQRTARDPGHGEIMPRAGPPRCRDRRAQRLETTGFSSSAQASRGDSLCRRRPRVRRVSALPDRLDREIAIGDQIDR